MRQRQAKVLLQLLRNFWNKSSLRLKTTFPLSIIEPLLKQIKSFLSEQHLPYHMGVSTMLASIAYWMSWTNLFLKQAGPHIVERPRKAPVIVARPFLPRPHLIFMTIGRYVRLRVPELWMSSPPSPAPAPAAWTREIKSWLSRVTSRAHWEPTLESTDSDENSYLKFRLKFLKLLLQGVKDLQINALLRVQASGAEDTHKCRTPTQTLFIMTFRYNWDTDL